MYAPAPATAAEIAAGYKSVDGAEDFEFVELQNIGSTTLPLAGLTFTKGVSFTFPSVSLAAGAYIVACSDPAAFAIRYGSSILSSEYGANWLTEAGYSGHFNNGGEEVTLDRAQRRRDRRLHLQQLLVSADRRRRLLAGGPQRHAKRFRSWSSSSGWEPSGTPGGTPGAAETVTHPAARFDRRQRGDVEHLRLARRHDRVLQHDFPGDQHRRLVRQQQQFKPDEVPDRGRHGHRGLRLLRLDRRLQLRYASHQRSGPPGPLRFERRRRRRLPVEQLRRAARRISEHQTIPAMPPGSAYGLYTKSDGSTNFTLLQTPDFGTLSGTTYSGAANSIPYVSPLVTDEIMYDPTQPTAAEAAAGYVDNDFEYVELYNRSSSPSRSAITMSRAGSATPRAGLPTACPTSTRRSNRGPPPPGRPPASPRPRTPSTPI